MHSRDRIAGRAGASRETSQDMMKTPATCLWCEADFTPRRTGGSVQKFCMEKHRMAFWAAARRWVLIALSNGMLTMSELRNGTLGACTLHQQEEKGSPVPKTRSDDNASH